MEHGKAAGIRGDGVKLGNWTDNPCYYVSIVDGPRHALVAGPFQTHEAALRAVEPARKAGYDTDPKSHFYGWGTAKAPNGYPVGKLNRSLEKISDAIHRGEWPREEDHAQATPESAQVAG